MDDPKDASGSEHRPHVTIFAKDGCPFCKKAKDVLAQHGMEYEEITLDGMVTVMSLKNVTGQVTVPQIFIDGKRIGGSDNLQDYFRSSPLGGKAKESFDSNSQEVHSFTPAH